MNGMPIPNSDKKLQAEVYHLPASSGGNASS